MANKCGHTGPDWNGEGDCITCARNKVLGANNTEDVELRKRLEAARFYDVLCNIHESHEEEDCFCTTEIAPYYRQLLAIVQQEANRQKAELLDRIEKAKPDFSDMDSYNHSFLKAMYENAIDKAIESERKQLKEVSNG